MQRAVVYVKKHGKSHSESVASFVEEGVVRRELSDNFCYYNLKYDSIEGARTSYILIRKCYQYSQTPIFRHPFFSVGDPDPHVFWASRIRIRYQRSGSGSFPFPIKVLSGLK